MPVYSSARSSLRSILLFPNNPFRTRRWVMNKSYYTPEMEEFYIGFNFEMMDGSSYQKGDFPLLLYTLSELDQYKDDFLKLAHANVRVQHLHEDDFKELGMTFSVIPRVLGTEGDGYIASAKINHPRKGEVKMEIFFAPTTNWTMITFNGHCVFAGTTMNISELKSTLKRIQGNDIKK